MDKFWPEKEMHSHNYRIPEPFKEQVLMSDNNVRFFWNAKLVYVALIT